MGHDCTSLHAAQKLAMSQERLPVGVLFRDESVPRYEDLRRSNAARTPERIASVLDQELDRFATD